MTKSNRIQATALVLAFGLITINCGGGSGGGNGGGSPAALNLSYNPQNLVAYPGTTFLLNITANASGTSAPPTISLGTLPTGLTTTTAFPLQVSSSGANIDFEIAAALAAGSYSIPITGVAGSATAHISVPLTISSGTPSQAYFVQPQFGEIGVIAGESSSIQAQVLGELAVRACAQHQRPPPGTSATFSPPLVQPGDTFTVTITASSSAPVAQNVELTITGTPTANVLPSTLTLLLDVTQPSGIGWTNRTTYVSTRATPFSAVYDPVHQLIFSSNQTWNRIDVISNSTHSLVRSLPVRDPRGLDISIDDTTIWVATGTQVMYGIDTTTMKATRYQLPRFVGANNSSATSWEGARVLSLVDGTVMLSFSQATGGGIGYSAIWDPLANTLTELPVPTGGPFAHWQLAVRSGDGKHLFSIGDDSAEVCFSYDVVTKSVSNAMQLTGYALSAVANADGSKIAIVDSSGFNLYDSNFNLLGPLAGDGGYGPTVDPIDGWIFGGSVFSPDGSTLYEETEATIVPVIVSINLASLQPTALAPAMPVIPVMTTLVPSFYISVPFAVDSSGMVLGVQYHGIAFDDALAYVELRK